MSAVLFGIPEGIALLTPAELAVWDSYQRFLHCIPLASEGPLGHDAIAITAALLALATATAPAPVQTATVFERSLGDTPP